MRPFVIDDNVREQIASLVEYAERNPFTMDNILDIYNGEMNPAGDQEQFVRHLPFGFRVAYSIDVYGEDKLRHLSMSVDTPGKMPHPITVEEMIKLIGFENDLSMCHIRMEEIGENHHAINVMEKITLT